MTRLTPELQEQIVAAIRAGGFPHIAAQAFGVSRRTFEHWRKLGRSNESEKDFYSFARAVDDAIAQARLRAEINIFTEQPRLWLQHGPGRELIDNPGWTALVKPAVRERTPRNPLMLKEVQAAIRGITDLLAAHPEIREQVATHLSELGA
jgi:transposase-like protein